MLLACVPAGDLVAAVKTRVRTWQALASTMIGKEYDYRLTVGLDQSLFGAATSRPASSAKRVKTKAGAAAAAAPAADQDDSGGAGAAGSTNVQARPLAMLAGTHRRARARARGEW